MRCLTRIFALTAALLATVVLAGALSGTARADQPQLRGNSDCDSASHPNPVVLLHGTMDSDRAWDALTPLLRTNGYCVYSLNYGDDPRTPLLGYGIGPITRSVAQVAGFIEQVLRRTGATQVDLVGHSQGGVIAEYYTKDPRGAAQVHAAIMLAPPTYGTTFNGLVTLADRSRAVRETVDAAVDSLICPACADMTANSPFITDLDTGPIAHAGVRYAVLATRYDTVVTPAGSASFIPEPGVTNQYIQDLCPTTKTTHQQLPRDPIAMRWVLTQLALAEPAQNRG